MPNAPTFNRGPGAQPAHAETQKLAPARTTAPAPAVSGSGFVTKPVTTTPAPVSAVPPELGGMTITLPASEGSRPTPAAAAPTPFQAAIAKLGAKAQRFGLAVPGDALARLLKGVGVQPTITAAVASAVTRPEAPQPKIRPAGAWAVDQAGVPKDDAHAHAVQIMQRHHAPGPNKRSRHEVRNGWAPDPVYTAERAITASTTPVTVSTVPASAEVPISIATAPPAVQQQIAQAQLDAYPAAAAASAQQAAALDSPGSTGTAATAPAATASSGNLLLWAAAAFLGWKYVLHGGR